MKLDRYILDLLKHFETNSDGELEPYQLMYELIRGEVASITWKPNLEIDHNGQLARITTEIMVEYYEHEKK